MEDTKDALVASYHRASAFTSYVAKRHPFIFQLLYIGFKKYQRDAKKIREEFGPEAQE